MHYAVTIKLPRNLQHNPRNKLTGVCPLFLASGHMCTDVTGEHHTFLCDVPWTVQEVFRYYSKTYQVTRVEQVHDVSTLTRGMFERLLIESGRAVADQLYPEGSTQRQVLMANLGLLYELLIKVLAERNYISDTDY